MKKTIISLAVLLTATLASQSKPAPTKPEVGKPAPIIRLNDHDGKAVQIKANDEERWTVLAFFPKAATPGWTREVCSLRDAATQLNDVDTDVYALSLDDVADLKKFATDQKLNFPLLSDPDGSAARKYGVLSERGYANRVTFIIDADGVLQQVIEDVDVNSHGNDLSEAVRAIRRNQ
jgi:peroxiredoxin Q/BCP